MNYEVTISLLSPLHIGTGDVLLRDYDFKTVGQHTWVLNQEAILADTYDRAGAGMPDWNRLALPPGQLVHDSELHEGSPFVRYALAGVTTVDQVREQIKDVYGRCYLPGSSLKGALRTLLMSHAVRSGRFKPDLNRLGDRREWAGQPWERAVFGPDPNHDLLRALIVADSDPLPSSPSPLMLLNAQVFTGGPPGSPIVVEALKPDTVFHTTLRVDDYLFSNAACQLGFADRREWLQNLARIAGQVSQARIEKEREWYRSRPGFQTALSFYNQLAQAHTGERAFLLQMAWGAGWTGKSVGFWLSKAEQDRLRQRYSLGRPPKALGWQPDLSKPFPKSRRLRARRNQGQVVADLPLGWVLVEMRES
jgi:CRISPR-associated protein Csm5